MIIRVRAIEVVPHCTFVKGSRSSGKSRTVLAYNGFGVGRAVGAWEPFHVHSAASYGVCPSADCAISLSDSSICIPVIAEQSSFLHCKNIPLLRLIQRCSGNLACSPPLFCSPKVLFFLQKQHIVSFSSPGRWIWMIACAEGYCSYLLF